MKIKYISLSVAFMLFSISMIAQSKVGTVNVNEILLNLPELATVNTKVASYNSELEKTLNEKITVYKTKLAAFKKNAPAYSDVMKKTMGEELYGLENNIKSFQQNGSQLTQLKQDDLLRPLYKKISDMIAIVAKEKNYTQILTVDGNEFAYVDEKFDITATVKSKLGIPAK
ncbi:MAG: OmpH family outer membrane protein [Flavobacteriaceae bacterium]|nr:OmpH family outer membrane protein [Flavobacteriaceae bacterium]